MIEAFNFLASLAIWFSPIADADQPFGDLGPVGTLVLFLEIFRVS